MLLNNMNHYTNQNINSFKILKLVENKRTYFNLKELSRTKWPSNFIISQGSINQLYTFYEATFSRTVLQISWIKRYIEWVKIVDRYIDRLKTRKKAHTSLWQVFNECLFLVCKLFLVKMCLFLSNGCYICLVKCFLSDKNLKDILVNNCFW